MSQSACPLATARPTVTRAGDRHGLASLFAQSANENQKDPWCEAAEQSVRALTIGILQRTC